jgi:hypothetical protein
MSSPAISLALRFSSGIGGYSLTAPPERQPGHSEGIDSSFKALNEIVTG